MTDILLFPMTEYWSFYVAFAVFVLAMLALDLGVFHRNAHEVSIREAAIWSAVWVGLALAFNAALYYYMKTSFPGRTELAGLDTQLLAETTAIEFLTGYVVEKALAVDNIFVFVAGVRLLRHSAAVSAPRALLRHPRRAGLPRVVHLARRGADAVPLGRSSSAFS